MQALDTTVTFLEMKAPPAQRAAAPHGGPRLMLLRANAPPVAFYRYLYEQVGKPWVWVNRRRMDDESLRAIVHDPSIEIFVLHADGAPAGYAELDRRDRLNVELAYFGLTPDFIGRGLGGWFLSEAIQLAWAGAPLRVHVQTCTLDHPRALQAYQRAGFTPFAQAQAWVLPIGDEPHPRVAALRGG